MPVATEIRYVAMLVETVVRFGHPRRPSFGRNRVAPHGIDLRHNRNAEFGINFGGGNSGAQSRPSAPYKKNVMRLDFHEYRLAAALGKVPASTPTLSVAHSVKNRAQMQMEIFSDG